MHENGERTGTWTVRRTGDGSPTLAHPDHGQACHSDIGAWFEACERYVKPCQLAQRAARANARPVRLLDVGTGPGWNLAAALAFVEDAGGVLEVWTLEHDPSVLHEMIATFEREPLDTEHARRHVPIRGALREALASGSATSLGHRSRLHLYLGDARETIRRLPGEVRFDAVFLDPFSPRVEPALWSRAFLANVAKRMAAGSWLSTYSTSLDVSVALTAAGLNVGSGPPVGRKSGSLASPDLQPPALDARTLRKIARRLLL